MSPLRRFLVLLLVLTVFSGPVTAQTPSPTPAPDSTRVAEIQSRLEEVQAQLQEPDLTPEALESARRLESIYRRQLTVLKQLNDAEAAQSELQKQLHDFLSQGLKEKPPYRVSLLDQLQHDLETANQKLKADELALSSLKKSLDLAGQRLEEAQKARRAVKDELDRAQPEQRLELELKLNAARQEEEMAEQAKTLASLTLDAATAQRTVTEGRAELLKRKVDWVEERFRFDQQTLDQQLQELESNRSELEQRLRAATTALDQSEEKLANLRDEPDASPAAIEAQAAWSKTHRTEMRLLEERLQRNLERGDMWQRRFKVRRGQESENFEGWGDEARLLDQQLEAGRRVLNAELSQIRAELDNLLDDDQGEITNDERSHAQALLARQRMIEAALDSQLKTELLAQRLASELGQRNQEENLVERSGRQLWQQFWAVWDIELYTLGDSAVTVRKVAVALLVLIIGLTLVKRVTGLISDRLLTKLPLKEAARVTMERGLRYFFILLVVLFSLHVVNIPLTIFTFLGGSLAIAFGFGAQNILNNFISGLILMVERPVKVGDLIEVDDTIGFVEEIGARSTRVRHPSGIHMVLPNSTLLENKVTNWTLYDHKLRTSVVVGVAYGSPTRKVKELLLKAAADLPEVDPDPEPIVIFTDFADSSLNFEIHFWMTIRSPMDKWRTQADLRYKIDDLFREHNIQIPFPQRDVHLDEPVQVKVISD